MVKFLEAASFGGRFPLPPNVLVVHSIECPIRAGLAASLAGPNYFGKPETQGGPGTSVHWLADPLEVVQGVPPDHIAYHVGPAGNPKTYGQEHTGYAHLTYAEWRTPNGLTQTRNGARNYARVASERGIPWRWLSLAQLARAIRTGRMVDGGLATHNDIRLVLGGTTHSDPGPNFPYAEFLAYGRKAFAPTPKPPLEDDMVLVKSTGRPARFLAGSAAPGVPTPELAVALGKLGRVVELDDSEYDLLFKRPAEGKPSWYEAHVSQAGA